MIAPEQIALLLAWQRRHTARTNFIGYILALFKRGYRSLN